MAVRGTESIKEATVNVAGTDLKVCVASGASAAQQVMEKVKAEEAERLKNQPVKVDVVRKERKPRPKKKG
jgi:hypothetical protein